MIVEARVVGQPRTISDRELPLPAGPHALRSVLERLVALEVAEFAERQREQSLLRVLTPADLVRGVESGKYATEPRAAQQAPTHDDALARAIEAFDDGLYFVFVDDQQIEDLDATIDVTPESRMRLVRLVALAGG
jgi:hypothetical protein